MSAELMAVLIAGTVVYLGIVAIVVSQIVFRNKLRLVYWVEGLQLELEAPDADDMERLFRLIDKLENAKPGMRQS